MQNSLCAHNNVYFEQKTCVIRSLVSNIAHIVALFSPRCGLVIKSESSHLLVGMYIKNHCLRALEPLVLVWVAS